MKAFNFPINQPSARQSPIPNPKSQIPNPKSRSSVSMPTDNGATPTFDAIPVPCSTSTQSQFQFQFQVQVQYQFQYQFQYSIPIPVACMHAACMPVHGLSQSRVLIAPGSELAHDQTEVVQKYPQWIDRLRTRSNAIPATNGGLVAMIKHLGKHSIYSTW